MAVFVERGQWEKERCLRTVTLAKIENSKTGCRKKGGDKFNFPTVYAENISIQRTSLGNALSTFFCGTRFSIRV